MGNFLRSFLRSVSLIILFSISIAQAWDDHALGTFIVFSDFPEFKTLQVSTESLEKFLKAEAKGLVPVLNAEEEWARKNVPYYPARPDSLRFEMHPGMDGDALKLRFLRALRVNPTVNLPLFLQTLPGQIFPKHNSTHRPIALEKLSLVPNSIQSYAHRFVALKEGEKIDAISVISTATDEPDYGLDMFLWENNGKEFGKEYQFGKQPFGNPVLEFSSQAPFHMGIYYESPLIYKLAKQLHRTYPEYRIHEYLTLSRYAFEKGHPYWGLRFAGWGLHYIQDLTQPFHSTSMPGVSTFKTIALGLMDLLGIHSPLSNQIQLVTNGHLTLENFAYHSLNRVFLNSDWNSPISVVLKNSDQDLHYPSFSERYPRSIIAKESHNLSQEVQLGLKKTLLSQGIMTDPRYLFGITDPKVNVLQLIDSSPSSSGQSEIRALLLQLMKNFGVHTRSYWKAISK